MNGIKTRRTKMWAAGLAGLAVALVLTTSGTKPAKAEDSGGFCDWMGCHSGPDKCWSLGPIVCWDKNPSTGEPGT